MSRSILIHDGQTSRDIGLVYICSGYLVERGQVLLVHHNRFDKWVPPGGHIEPGESFAGTAVREFKEETGLPVEAQLEEVHGAGWFGLDDLDELPTFEQVRSLARFALLNYPVAGERAQV
ncbi:NUDIX domain-containing protein [Streptomyces graminilatus]|uniref:NUDIX domain-containing protein n=1 Tax=Streptomyces graminilatus TaxID=1464070 RepID=UPI0006E2EC68|nr:NUDIX domain-containing protein [Streptomyces graminilatus]